MKPAYVASLRIRDGGGALAFPSALGLFFHF